MSLTPETVCGEEDPLYNIGVVTRMTHISTATLRAWERRYEFPLARRTAGGHRLYSEKDILRLQWVKQRVDEGMQTAQAINALRHQEQSGRLSFRTEFQTDRREKSGEQPVHKASHQRLLEAVKHNDLTLADQILGEALAISLPEDIILDVIAPVLASVGEAWESRHMNVAAEHLTTNYLRQRLLMWMLSGPPPRQTPPIVLACAPGEWHEGSLLIVGALLRRRRWPVAYLGQAVPLSDLAVFVREIKPSGVILVAMLEETAAELVEWPQYLPEAALKGKPPVGYGGRVYTRSPEWRLRMPGNYLGDNFQEGIGNIERLFS